MRNMSIDAIASSGAKYGPQGKAAASSAPFVSAKSRRETCASGSAINRCLTGVRVALDHDLGSCRPVGPGYEKKRSLVIKRFNANMMTDVRFAADDLALNSYEGPARTCHWRRSGYLKRRTARSNSTPRSVLLRCLPHLAQSMTGRIWFGCGASSGSALHVDKEDTGTCALLGPMMPSIISLKPETRPLNPLKNARSKRKDRAKRGKDHRGNDKDYKER